MPTTTRTTWLLARKKAIVAILGGTLAVATGYYATGNLGHILSIALAAVTAAGVYIARNGPDPLPKSAQPTARHMAAQRAARRAADQQAGQGQKPAAVINVPPRPSVAPPPPWPSGGDS